MNGDDDCAPVSVTQLEMAAALALAGEPRTPERATQLFPSDDRHSGHGEMGRKKPWMTLEVGQWKMITTD